MTEYYSGRYPDLLVGLSLGRDMSGERKLRRLPIRISEHFPKRWMTKSGANLVVCNREIARRTVARWAEKRDLPLLVWTVDDLGELDHWLTENRAWMVTTNYPGDALVIRDKGSISC